MTQENKDILLRLLQQHKALGISDQIDYEKFYLYSIITHSTAIEGSTVTEVEAQLLFDEGITSSKRTMLEQQMNLDLKVAYDYGREWIRRHEPITVDWLILLASKVMARTGSEYHSIGGDFSAAKGELRKLNVTAGTGGKSYMAYQKVPARLAAFCEELNRRRKAIDPADVAAVYDLSFWAHFELVTIHPWADGNGRTCRLLMNLLQWEFGVLPTKVLKEDKAEYIQALIDTRESEDLNVFLDCMARHHCQHLKADINQFVKSTTEKVVDKQDLKRQISEQREPSNSLGRPSRDEIRRRQMVDKWSIKPSLAEKMVDILEFVADKDQITTEAIVARFGFTPTTAKRYLRQLTEFGYLESHGGNKNRTYTKK
jgi:Fic family protein